jgi:hypothetical protein
MNKQSFMQQLNNIFLPELSGIIWDYLNFYPFIEAITQKYFFPGIPPQLLNILDKEKIFVNVEPIFQHIIEKAVQDTSQRKVAMFKYMSMSEQELNNDIKIKVVSFDQLDLPQDPKEEDYIPLSFFGDFISSFLPAHIKQPYFPYLYEFYGSIDAMIWNRFPEGGLIPNLNTYSNKFHHNSLFAFRELFRFAYCIKD